MDGRADGRTDDESLSFRDILTVSIAATGKPKRGLGKEGGGHGHDGGKKEKKHWIDWMDGRDGRTSGEQRPSCLISAVALGLVQAAVVAARCRPTGPSKCRRRDATRPTKD